MGIIDVEVARRVARLMAEREAASGIRLEIASVELPEDGGDLVVQFRPWTAARRRDGRPDDVGPADTTGSAGRDMTGSLH